MTEKFIRIYQKLDVNNIKPNLLIYGDISGSCANCSKIDIKLDDRLCPECAAEFKFIAFRRIKSHLPKLHKLSEARPDLKFVDYDDYKKSIGGSKVEDFFG